MLELYRNRTFACDESNRQVSKLYSLLPIGIGTVYVECLTSYIIRLAHAHCVFLGTIFNHELVPELKKQYLFNYTNKGGNGFFDRAYSVNGNDKNAYDFMCAIYKFTHREEIWNTNLLSLKGIISSRGILKKYLYWCPVCFDEWIQNNDQLYIPLIWNFRCVKVCTKHNTLLTSECPNCTKELPIFHRKSIIGYCPYCNEWLGNTYRTYEYQSKTDVDWNNWAEVNIGEILSLGLIERESITRGQVTIMLNALYNHFNCKKYEELATVFRICKSTMRDWLKGITYPSLDVLLLISFGLNIKLLDILSDSQFSSINISFGEFIKKINSVQVYWPEKEQIHHDTKLIGELLHRHLKEEVAASVSSISRELHCDKKVLSNRFPQLYKLLVKKRKYYIEKNKVDRQKEIETAIVYVIDELVDSGIYPSRRKVEALLKSNINVKEQFVKSVWKKKIEGIT